MDKQPLKKFKKERIWWHKKWWAGVPLDYYLSILLSLIILLPAIFYSGIWYLAWWWCMHMLFFTIQTALLVCFSLVVLKIDNWKK